MLQTFENLQIVKKICFLFGMVFFISIYVLVINEIMLMYDLFL